MRRDYGGHTMVGRLRRVLVRPPDSAFGEADPRTWHYGGRPDLARSVEEHDAFVARLHEAGAEVLYHRSPVEPGADAIYVHDPCLVTDGGAILLRMGKTLRRAEPEALSRTLEELGLPLLGRITGTGRAEGGDLLWLDRRTLAVGQGHRTNREGWSQLAALLAPLGVCAIALPLPDPFGPEACLHLMSLVSLVDRDLALVYRPLLPPPLADLLAQRGVRCIEVAEEEFLTLGTNVLALAPRDCLMLEGNPRTRGALEAQGCRVRTYRGREISIKGEGGPTCLTRAILREG